MPYFDWMPAARQSLRAIDRLQAQQLLIALSEYATSQQGDVLPMRGNPPDRLRLRCGDYRVIFRQISRDSYQVLKVGHRRDIYR
ncbi:MAG: type II toxin-antitoxin system RelE/ParE family toxin [Acidobacteria bacterium]|nr:type II toxin-antitoxin system RelE/ParE family toxin [Acidobacteriota bacterium]